MSEQTMNEPESKNVLNTLKINGDYIQKRIGFKFGYICIKPVVGRIIRISVDRIRKCNRETKNVSIETMEFGKMELVFPTITKAIIFYNVINGIVRGKCI